MCLLQDVERVQIARHLKALQSEAYEKGVLCTVNYGYVPTHPLYHSCATRTKWNCIAFAAQFQSRITLRGMGACPWQGG